ncbi:MAG TPA: PEGA domain-containing protein [Polyangia bacterium]|jgi:hypothetical protein
MKSITSGHLLVVVLAAVVALPAPSRAAEGGGSVAVTVFLLPHPGVTDQHAEQVMRALEGGLRKNQRLSVKDSNKLLADYAGEVPTDIIASARKLLGEGQQAMLELDTTVAIRKLTQAVEALETVLPFIQKNELADAMIGLAVAQLSAGERKAGKQTLLRLLTWREGMTYDTEKLPGRYLDVFEEAKREIRKRARGMLEIRSNPDGAQAYVDGKYVGVTPAAAEGLTVGEHYITLKKEGYQKVLLKAPVSAKKQESVTGELKRSEKYKLVQDSLRRAQGAVEQVVADAGMVDLKAFLFIDQVLFVRLTTAGPKIHLDAYLYDLRSKRRLSVVRRDLDPAAIDAAATGTGIAENLYLNVPYDGALVAPPDEKPPERVKRRAFYTRWWFWTAIGITATAIAVPVALVPGEGARAHEPFRRVDVSLY